MTDASAKPAAPPGGSQGRTQGNALIEIGLILVGRLDRIDRQAVAATRDQMRRWLQERFPEFQWRLTLIRREEVPLNIRQEPSAMLRDGSFLRDAEGWDFALLFTSADLISRYKPYALSVTSSSLDLAIISTNRIDPHASDADVDDETRLAALITRLTTLCLRSIGHLNGLSDADAEDNLMCEPKSPQALAQMVELDSEQLEDMKRNLAKIADLRLEETHRAAEISPVRFYVQSAWINRHEIADAIIHAHPWEFPVRLLRLSAAALSTMVILMITAETWHLASIQPIPKLSTLLVLALIITTTFVAIRQRLFVQRVAFQISEQTVITNLAAAMIVLTGMTTTALVLMLVSLTISVLFYSHDLIAAWISAEQDAVGWWNYLQTNMLVTTLGLLIGALGASFEEQHHFRHIVFVDEET